VVKRVEGVSEPPRTIELTSTSTRPKRGCVAPYEANHLSYGITLCVRSRGIALAAVEGQFHRDRKTAARRIFEVQSTAEQPCETGRHREIEAGIQLFAP
jgi:hypothetical protein